MRVALLACAMFVLAAAPAAAAPAWLAPGELSQPGRDASNPVVAMDAGGNTVAAWERQSTSGPSHIVQVSTRVTGASFSAPTTLSEAATRPEVAITPGGEAVIAWWHFANPPGVSVLELATRSPGGSFSAPVEITSLPAGVIPGEAQLAISPGGDVLLAWASRDPESVVDPSANFIEASVRPAGGAFSAPQVISPQPVVEKQSAFLGGAAIDDAGEATVTWDYESKENDVIEAASAPPGSPFSPAVQLTPGLAPEEDAIVPDVGVDTGGDLTVVWQLATATTDTVEAATRDGGGFSTPVALSEPGQLAFAPQIAAAPGGAATVVWELSSAPNIILQGVTRPDPGSPFSAPIDISAEEGQASAPNLAANANGETLLTWSGSDGSEQVVLASIRRPGGSFSVPVAISATSPDTMRPAAALDGAGDATVLWPRSNGVNSIIQFAGYDAFAPQLRGLSIPATGTVGTPVAFSVSPFDVWPLGAAVFAFGDGAQGAGDSLTHTYSAAGTYRVGVTATDGAGTPTSSEGSITIAPRSDFSIGKLKLNKKKGTATLKVSVPGPGRLVLSAKGIRKVSKRVAKAGLVTLAIDPQGKAKKRLDRSGKLKLKLSISFTPKGGTTAVHKKSVKLLKKRG